MRRVCLSVLGLALVGILAQPALGQGQGRGQGRGGRGAGMGGIAGLLNNESVQKELKLDSEQVDKIKAAIAKVRQQHEEDFTKLRDLDQEEQRTKRQELTKTVSEELLKSAGGILTPDQVKRLKQIDLQQAGTRAFTRADVEKGLNLTADQKEKIKAISEDAAKEMNELRQAGGGQGNREKMTELRNQTNGKIQAVLTDDQKKTWKEMTGEPFQIQRGGRGSGGGAAPRTRS